MPTATRDATLNDLFTILGIQSWKPVVTTLVLPPVPWLLVMLLGARLMFWRRSAAWLLMLVGAFGIWLSGCMAFGEWLQQRLLNTPPPMAAERIGEVKRAVAGGKKFAIVVLGGGREAMAPEYGVSNLKDLSLSRLHFGLWLSRQTGAPVMFSGGVGLAESVGISEAEAAARIAERDYGRALTWIESESRDTRENAARSIAMLKSAAVTDVIVVTHGWHMQRAMRAFEAEARRAGAAIQIVAAPMGLASTSERPVLTWMPTVEGFARVRHVLREAAGLLFGA
jgi:uncharacterized SAM-binding protein YcdF (DUF218 family)